MNFIGDFTTFLRNNRQPAIIAAIFLTASLIQSFFIFQINTHNPEAIFASDPFYRTAAANFLNHRTYSTGTYPDLEPEVLRTPGYALTIAAAYSFTGSNHLAFIVFQNIVGLLNLLLVFRLANLIFKNRTAALISTSLYAFSLIRMTYINLDYSEIMTSFFLLTGTFFCITAFKLRTPRWSLFLASLSFTLAVLISTSIFYLFMIIIIVIIFTYIREHNTYNIKIVRMSLLTLIVFIFPIVTLLGAWTARNYVRVGLTDLSTLSAYNLYYYFGGRIIADKRGISFGAARDLLATQMAEDGISKSSATAQRGYWTKNGLSIILENPLIFAKRQLLGMVSTMASGIASPGPVLHVYSLEAQDEIRKISHEKYLDSNKITREVLRLNEFVGEGYFAIAAARIFNILWHFIFFVFAIIFFIHFILSKNRYNINIILLICIIGFMLILSGPNGQIRYRVPIEPFITLFSGTGLTLVWQWFTKSSYWNSMIDRWKQSQ